MSPSRRRTAALFVAAALARTTEDRALADTNAAQAESLYKQATREMDQKDWATACPRLEEVVKLVPEGLGARLTLAQCYEGWSKLASSNSQYLLLQAAATKAGDKPRVQKARAGLERTQARLSYLVITLAPGARALPGLEVTRNGAPVGAAVFGVSLPVDLGSYAIAAKAPGRRPFANTVVVDKEQGTVSVMIPDLAPDAVAEPPRPPPSASAPPPRTAPPAAPPPQSTPPARTAWENPRPWQLPVGLMTLGLGVVAGSVGGGLAGAAKAKYDESNELECNGSTNVCSASGLAMRKDAFALADAATALVVVGSIVGVGGLVVALTSPRAPAEPRLGLIVRPWLGVAQAALLGSW